MRRAMDGALPCWHPPAAAATAATAHNNLLGYMMFLPGTSRLRGGQLMVTRHSSTRIIPYMRWQTLPRRDASARRRAATARSMLGRSRRFLRDRILGDVLAPGGDQER